MTYNVSSGTLNPTTLHTTRFDLGSCKYDSDVYSGTEHVQMIDDGVQGS